MPQPLPSPRALAVLGVALICAAAAPVRAGIVLPDADPVENPDRTPLTLVTQQVDVTIVDQVATTKLVQVFRNDTTRPVSGTYLLPLGPAAAVQSYAFWLGGRRIESRIGETEDAKETFEGAQDRGEAASIVEQTDDDTFTARFTELAAGEVRRFEVLYSELLPYEAGKVRYSHPLDYAESGLPAVKDLRVSVRIEDGKPISAVRAPTWPARIEALGDAWAVDARMQDAVPAADFELEYEVQSTDFGLTFRTFDDGSDEGFFVAMVAPKEEAADDEIVRKDVAFVFDTSGSMSGPKIDQARKALKAALNLMNPGDGVYLLAFSGTTNPWRAATEELDEPLRVDASTFVDSLQARGGTNIHDAVLTGLKILEPSNRPTALVFLTDGNGSRNPEEVLGVVARANPDRKTRIFTFGVGGDVNGAFLERLGRENRGGYTAIGHGTSIDEAVAAFYAGISRPVLTDLAFDFGEIVPNRLYPAMTPDIYQGQRLVLTGRYRGDGGTTLKVRGRIGGEERELSVPVAFEENDEHPWVARLWARRRADHLLAEARMYGETAEIRDEVVALSTEYSFATPYTSLVAHADPRVASLTPQRIKPGDPVLTVPAPRDAVAVTAFLPFGEVKDMVPVPGTDAWTTRFLVPRSVLDGVYWIHVVATSASGRSEWFRISYTVDTTAPVLLVDLDEPEDGSRPGDRLVLGARPVVGFLELGQEMIRSLGRDAAARAKAYVDIKDVVARLGGTRVQVRLESDADAEAGWHGELQLPLDLEPGLHTLEVTATDVAGNKHTVIREFEVFGLEVTAGSTDLGREVQR